MKEQDRTIEKAPNEPLRPQEQNQLEEFQATRPEVALADQEPPAPIPPKKTISEGLREAAQARKEFDGARKKLEEERGNLEKARKALEDERKKLEEKQRRFDQLPAEERKLQERASDLDQREENARRGFLREREEILGPVQRERAQLRQERADAEGDMARWRSEQEQAWRKEREERLVRWQKEEEEHSRQHEERRSEQERELRQRREESLARLAREMQQIQDEFSQRCRMFNEEREARKKALEEQERKLNAELRKAQAERENLQEEREALKEKIERKVAEQVRDERQEFARLREELDRIRRERDELYKRAQDHLALERQFNGASPADILKQTEALKKTVEELRRQLADRPGLHERERLQKLEREKESWNEERAAMGARVCELEARLSTRQVAAVQLEGLRNEREALEAQNKILTRALGDLKKQVEDLTRLEGNQHPLEALKAIDREQARQMAPVLATTPPEAPASLKALVNELQQRLFHEADQGAPEASRRLFYPEAQIRCFLAGMAQSQLSLLQGISGTGKTSLALGIASALGAEKEIVAVQAGWRDRQDLLGHYNVLHGRYHATNFLQALYRAQAKTCSERPFFLVLDEINLSRVEQFFADLLSALEQPPGERRLTILGEPVAAPPEHLLDGRHLPLPGNVWFVGTANHDESTIEFADKTYDRAHIMELERSPLPAQLPPKPASARRMPISMSWLEGRFRDAQKKHSPLVDEWKTWLRSAGPMLELERTFRIRWGNRFERDLERFVPVLIAAGGQDHEGIDHLLVTKVLRKLHGRHDIRVSQLESLRKAFDKDAFGKQMPRSIRQIELEISLRGGEEIA